MTARGNAWARSPALTTPLVQDASFSAPGVRVLRQPPAWSTIPTLEPGQERGPDQAPRSYCYPLFLLWRLGGRWRGSLVGIALPPTIPIGVGVAFPIGATIIILAAVAIAVAVAIPRDRGAGGGDRGHRR